jgi:phosphatidylglycerol:prolipoprotein diacylglycerol transferase
MESRVIAPTELGRSRWLGRRYLLDVGGFRLPSYTVMLYLGIVVGFYVGALVAGAQGLSQPRFVAASVVLLGPALVGARLWYVAQHATFYRTHPGRIWSRSEGGSALYGGLVLSIAVSVPVLALVDLPFLMFWDAAILTMLAGLVVTRLGCSMHGCCAGRETSGRLLGVWLPNHRGEWARRVPTQLLEAGWALLVLVAALLVRPSLPFAGALFAFVVGAYAAGRLVLELTRESDAPSGTIWVNVAFSALLLAGAATLLAVGLTA